ncbi:hypothetical protein EfmAA290_06720 [Enterococcus faecium]|nr:hypothetical protein EfmAA290_06720 [Enterococcus faecium]
MSLFSFSDLLLFVGKKIESKRLFSIKYLAMAVLLQAGLDGIRNQITPPENYRNVW